MATAELAPPVAAPLSETMRHMAAVAEPVGTAAVAELVKPHTAAAASTADVEMDIGEPEP
ncbi:hypothetical protein CSQ86_08595 [Bifidobacterium felsineum]|uniref:Uncharacterized protein n=1 Tax=Bifidobacterium felsineum TaxID=2045440 RepID=A0A2M9HI80_9BIFI|nr:hypothetical protein CSQ86_08595 [Bifidobacterium felsineum]